MRYKLTFENEIGSVEFSIGSRIIVEGVSSFGGQNAEFLTTQSNREIGERLNAQSIRPKTLQIHGTILGEADAIREQMKHVIAPLAESKLIYNDEYELTVFVRVSPDIERYAANARFSFSLFAPYPYWRLRNKDTTTLVGLRALFSFPWNFSDPNPFSFSEYVETGYVTIHNNGEAPAYWTAVLHALDEVTKPKIYNMETGEYVRILKTMAEGEQIIISTEGDELTVEIKAADGTITDGFRYLDVESMPFKLAVGENFIKTVAEKNTNALRASISFQPSFVGV